MSTEDRQDNRQEPGRLVRPYAMTGGRTRPAHDDLELETLVSTTSLGETSLTLSLERRSIALLCRDILSIAEISARLDLPLGVVRVLVGDLEEEGAVRVHGLTTEHSPTSPATTLSVLESVLDGISSL